ncbi:winged helix-turn-helix transcriptional regulator, partial [Lampropedia puyangensis]
MIDVATLSAIRRWALREHLSIREIARRTGLSHNTIRKYLRADVVQAKACSKLEPFTQKLSGWLRTEASRSRKQPGIINRLLHN